jgi:hypothetical protein
VLIQELQDEIAAAKFRADEAKKHSADAKDAASDAERDATSAQDAASDAKNAHLGVTVDCPSTWSTSYNF